MTRISVLGESLVDVVDRQPFPGGSPLNVAVGLSRLEHHVTFHTEFGLDEYGGLIAEHLRRAGVHLADGTQRLIATNQAQVKLDAERRASYRFNITWDLPDDVVAPGTDLLHTGSIGAWLEPGGSKVLAAFENSPATQIRSYDPNIRAELATDRPAVLVRVEKFMSLAHVVKLSESDAAWLYPDSDPAEVLQRVLALGPQLVVLTRGALGCIAQTSTDSFAQPALVTEVVDTVGAGAAFMAGLLHGVLRSPMAEQLICSEQTRLDQAAVQHALRCALASASVTVSRSGANPPTAVELASVVASNS